MTAPDKPYGTPPTQIRLTADDLAAVERLKARFGLPSIAAAVRMAVHMADRATAAEIEAIQRRPATGEKKPKGRRRS
jgi:hypothetical protein